MAITGPGIECLSQAGLDRSEVFLVDLKSHSYRRQMIEYYDGAKYSYDWDSVRQSYIDDEGNLSVEQRRTIEQIQQVFSGRRVLELAAGGGRWTKHIAQTAESVLATDTSEQVLAIGCGLVNEANVEFVQSDAFDLGQLDERFDAAFHFNFINHVPYSDWHRLVENVHRKLTRGAVVVMGGQRYRAPESDDGIDYYSDRECSNGKRYRLIDNLPDEAQVESVIGHLVEDMEFTMDNRWWTEYTVP